VGHSGKKVAGKPKSRSRSSRGRNREGGGVGNASLTPTGGSFTMELGRNPEGLEEGELRSNTQEKEGETTEQGTRRKGKWVLGRGGS